MSWDIRKIQRSLLASETNLCPKRNGRGGQLSICLVYPNRYQTGMSSLGYQTVYSLLATYPGVLCERAFLPDRESLAEYRRSGMSLLSLESQRPLADFDIIAFSTSFEPDYLNIPLILKLGRIPVWAKDRGNTYPLIIAGGAAFMINPEPVADFLDVVCLGEGEVQIPELMKAMMVFDKDRQELLLSLAALPGIYIPSLYRPQYLEDRLVAVHAIGAAPKRFKRVCAKLDEYSPARSVILTDNTEFGDMYLIEVSRGCPRGCRFCTSGFIYGHFRQQPYSNIIAAVDEGLAHRNKIGLVGAAVSDYHDIGMLCSYIVARGAKVSVSSLRIDRLDPEMINALVASGHKTIALAPEGGSQRLRDLIRKNLNEEQILEACELLVACDILNLRLYFIIGLPTETPEDLDELIRLVLAIRSRVLERARLNRRLGEITLSINPFIPKPGTPFQWCGMEPLPSLEQKVKFLEAAFRGVANVRLKVEGLRDCYFQALLSRGDRRLSDLLVAMCEGHNLKKAAKICAIDTDNVVQRTIPADELLPWGMMASDGDDTLRHEYERAMALEGRR